MFHTHTQTPVWFKAP